MQQNSEDWYKWRQKGLGGSDSPIVMGESEYMTPFQLWLQKTTGESDQEVNEFITRLGHKFEPMMKADLVLELGFSMEPTCVEHSEIPWLRASLDAENEENKIFAEIKYVGKEKLENAKKGIIHRPHWIQMQHQFMVTGYSKAIYAAYTLDSERKAIDETVTVPVEPDMTYITDTLFPALKKFWEENVQKQKAPELTKRDTKEIKDEKLIEIANKYKKANDLIKKITKVKEELRDQLIEAKKSEVTYLIGDLKIKTQVSKGSVDYTKVPQLKGVDLDQYRKPAVKKIVIT